MNNNHKLMNLIEKKRAELTQLVIDRKIFDDNVVKKSQELDLLINYFNDNVVKEKKAQ